MASISVQLYSVRAMIDQDLRATLHRLAALGLRHAEPYAFHLRMEEYRRALDETGLTFPSGHAAVIDAVDPNRIFAAAAALDIRTVIDPYLPADRWRTAEQAARIAERVNELTVWAAAFGLRFGYHNHDWELSIHHDHRTALGTFIDRLVPEAVLEIDTYWATVGGADVPGLLHELGDRVQLIHVKDGARDGDLARHVPAGQGEIDIPAILTAAPNATRVIEFDRYDGDVVAAIGESLAWVDRHDRREDAA